MFAILGTVGITLGRVLIGLILCIAGIGKIRNGHSRFLKVVLGYDLVPRKIAFFLSYWLPWVEILTGTLLLIGLHSRVAAFTAFGLLFLFSGAIVFSLLNKKDNSCGCFGRLTPIQWRLVYRNVFLMGVLVPVYAFAGGPLSVDTWNGMTHLFLDRSSIALLTFWGTVVLGTLLLHWLIRLRIVTFRDSQSR